MGFCQVRAFGAMEELTQLMVLPSHQGRGIARNLVRRCWPGDPTPEVGRVVVAVGAPGDLTLYQEFGVMPVAGHWHLRAEAGTYRAAALAGDRRGGARPWSCSRWTGR